MIDGLARAIRILELFSSDVPEWSVSEVARELDLPKTTTWEWMRAMADLGLIRRSGRKYRLSWRAFQLGSRARMSSEIARPALAEIAALGEQFGETAHLAVRHGRDIVFLEKSAPKTGIRVSMTRPGERLPANCTAEGKALLASLQPEEVLGLFMGNEMPAMTRHSLVTVDDLEAELAKIRERGWACDVEEWLEGLCGVAAPVSNRHGQIVWVLSLSFPEYRLGTHLESYAEAVAAAAQRLSAYHERVLPALERPRRNLG